MLGALALVAVALTGWWVLRTPGAGWLEGRIGVAANRCTMVFLKEKAPGGYTSMVLAAVASLERREGERWVAVDLKSALAQETKACREAAND